VLGITQTPFLGRGIDDTGIFSNICLKTLVVVAIFYFVLSWSNFVGISLKIVLHLLLYFGEKERLLFNVL
jgi:hypothetical protein